MYFKYSYKSYKESKKATAISAIGGFFYVMGKIVLGIMLIELFKVALSLTESEKSNLYIVIILTIITSVVMFAMGFLLNFIAKKVALKDFQKMLQLSYQEVEELVNKKPQLKELFMQNHISYREMNENYIYNESIDNIKTENLDIKKGDKKKLLRYYIIISIITIGVIFVVNNISSFDSSALNKDQDSIQVSKDKDENSVQFNNDKYQCYIQFNNDIVECYEISINPYLKDKGMNEKIEDYREPDEVQINPMIKTRYEQLEKARDAVNQKPKMDIDKDVIELADSTEKIYDLIGEIYYCYGGEQREEYGNKTNKTKEELHKEFVLSIQEYDSLYENFSIKLDKIAIEYMSNDLQKYKDDNDMDSYYTLDIMIESQKVYEYFINNNITNENLFYMNLDEYNEILKEYNEAYSNFEKQDIKGGTVHTTGFRDFMKAYHSFVNNIVNMVNEKNFEEGNLDGPKGLVSPNENEDIQQRLYFYIDRMISSYNSIQLFKN